MTDHEQRLKELEADIAQLRKMVLHPRIGSLLLALRFWSRRETAEEGEAQLMELEREIREWRP